MKTYFVINQPDGDQLSISKMTEPQLLKALKDGDWGDRVKFLKDLPNMDSGCFMETGVLIIEGNIVVPKPVQTVTEYKL